MRCVWVGRAPGGTLASSMPGDTTFGTYLCEVPLDQLVAEARAQERRHPNEGATDDAPGLELFRRAMAEGDEAAWHAIVELYRGPLLAQAGRHAVRPLVSESDAFCVDRAFERLPAERAIDGQAVAVNAAPLIEREGAGANQGSEKVFKFRKRDCARRTDGRG